ncbi:MAG: hypothetical protein JWM74_2939 [Myxococcaceae bacterium]|nr:hypothetical protein [Myxococcaceae bacterium]
MNKLIFSGILLLVACGAGCGGATDPDAQDSGSDASASSDTGSSGEDTGTASDAGVKDTSTNPVGLAPDPGLIACGGAPCKVPGNYCCIDAFDGGKACKDDSVSSCGGDRKACDETADCTGSTPLCCSPPSAAAPPRYYDSTFCAPTCATYQVCKTNAECVNGKPCVPQTCRGRTVQTCGALPAGACDS